MTEVLDGKYELVRQLGEGGMGAVYEARHLGTGRRVALKMINAQALAAGPDVITRFHREARAGGAIESEHVVHVFDTGVNASGNPYMVMELLRGEDLHQLLARIGPLVPDAALRVLAQACIGLGKAHEAGIVHRDLKSANLFLARRDSGELIVKLLDFGIAKVRADPMSPGADQGLTRTGSMMGSPLYMSPEQATGSKDLDQRSDLYSLGVVLYEVLTGKTPYAECATLGEIILAICTAEPPAIQTRAPWVPPEVAAIVHRAIAHDPAARFQTAAEMHSAIVALLPHATQLTDAQLQPLPAEIRRRSAPRLDTAPNPLARTPIAGMYALRTPAGGITAPGSGQLEAQPTHKPTRTWLVALIALVVIGVGITGYLATRGGTAAPAHDDVAATQPVTLPSAPTPAPVPPAPAPAPTPAAPVPAIQTVSIAIAPVDATATVDGVATTAHGGAIDLEGTIGSVHKVKLTKAGRSTEIDVVIAATGPVPARVELPAAVTTHTTQKPGPTPNDGKKNPAIDRSFD